MALLTARRASLVQMLLVALALDSSNDARLAHRVEDEILGRLISDIESDTALFTAWSKNLEEKLKTQKETLEEKLEAQKVEIDKYFLTNQKFLWTVFGAVPALIVATVAIVTLIHHY